MYLFFDTETTGLPRNHDAPATDVDNWPRIVQFAWTLTDKGGSELRSEAFVIRPNGFDIPPSATRIHGISTAQAKRLGIEVKDALSRFAEDLVNIEVLVAHNLQFDQRVVGAEFCRAGLGDPWAGKNSCCTMRSSTDLCRIPGGPRGYKWPTLDQLHRKLFGVPMASAHNAVDDVRACAKCFFELERIGLVSGSKAAERK